MCVYDSSSPSYLCLQAENYFLIKIQKSMSMFGVLGMTFDLSCACTVPSWFLCLTRHLKSPGTRVVVVVVQRLLLHVLHCPSLSFPQHSDHLWAIVKTDRGAAKIAHIVHTVTPQLLANQFIVPSSMIDVLYHNRFHHTGFISGCC